MRQAFILKTQLYAKTTMEPGKPQLIWQEVSSAALILSSGKTAEQMIDRVYRLAAEANSRDTRLENLQTIPVSLSMARLEIWAYCLAAELIRQWQFLAVAAPPISTILAELGLNSAEGTVPLIDALGKANEQTPPAEDLKERIQALYKQQEQEKLSSAKLRLWLEREAVKLADWFTQMPTADSLMSQSPEEMGGCLAKLQFYAPTLHTQMLQTLNICWTQLQLSGSQVILRHLNLLSQALQKTLENYEDRQQECLRRERGAWRAYHNLMNQIETKKWGPSGKGNLAWAAVLRALNLIYASKLEAETYALASQLVNDLIRQTRQYAAAVAQTDTLLTYLQNWFIQRCPSESVFPPVLKSFLNERIDPWDLRRQIEQWAGHSLPQWGTVESIQPEALRAQILTRLSPVCLAVYGECCAALALGISAPDNPFAAAGDSALEKPHDDA
jgi:hypothetical protein